MASVIFYMTLLLCAVALSEGCSCAVPTIPPTAGWKGNVFGYWNMQRFCDADFAIRAKVLRSFHPEISDSEDSWSVGPASYTVKVLKTFKGSWHENEITRLETPANGGLCGVHLNVNGEYLLTGGKNFGPFDIMLCDWFEPWSKKTFKQIRKFSKKC